MHFRDYIMNQPIMAIDIGTSKIVILIGQLNAKNKVDILQFIEVRNEGLVNGIISDTEKVIHAIRSAIAKVSSCFNSYELSVVSNYSGDLKFLKAKSTMSRECPGEEICKEDIFQLEYQLLKVVRPGDMRFIRIQTYKYTVDEIDEITDPIGMCGEKLGVDGVILSANRMNIKKIGKCFSSLSLDLKEIYPNGLATAHAVLYPEEMEEVFALIDTGAALTHISIIRNGIVEKVFVIKTGGNAITSDISDSTCLGYEQAEELKIKNGSIYPDEITAQEIIRISYPDGRKGIPVNKKQLAEVIRTSVEEMVVQAWNYIRAYLPKNQSIDSLILTGGGISQFPHIEELVKHITRQKCRIGLAGVQICPDSASFAQLNSPVYATSVGLLAMRLLYD